jgi:hypothetical protein
MDYKYLGLVAVIQLWVCLLLMIRVWKGNSSMTYSEHAAKTKTASLYYFVVFSIHLVLFYVFALKWFVPNFSLPSTYMMVLTIALTGQFIAVLVPTTGGVKTKIHDIAAYTMHMLLVPLNIFIVLSPSFSQTARYFTAIMLIYMIFVWYIMATDKLKNKRLILQTFYGLSFHLSILVATFF